MARLIEGLWDCSYCETKGIKGGIRECPNCGRPRDENTKFYLPSNIEANYVEEEKTKTINRNPDWICEYCDSLNSDNDAFCVSCGAERGAKNYFSNKKEKISNEELDIKEDSKSDYTDVNTNQNYGNKKGIKDFFKEKWKILVIIPLIISFIIGLVFLFIPKEETITISGFKWERSIEIERYQTVEESDWTLPTAARLLYTNQELYGYEQVIDHYEIKTERIEKEKIVGYEDYVVGYNDLGNGYFEEIVEQRPKYETYYEEKEYEVPVYRDEPIYRTKYYYEIDKWLYERTVLTKDSNKEPYWGEVNLSENERESTKKEIYYVIGKNEEGKSRQLKFSYEEWSNLEIGQTVKLKVSIFGDAKTIE